VTAAAVSNPPRSRRHLSWLPATGILLGLAVAAEAAVRAGRVSSYLLPAPSQVLLQLVKHWDAIGPNLWVTTVEAVGGFLIASILAVIIATAFVYFRPLEQALFPLIVVLQTVPVIIIAPILIIVFGNGMGPKVIIAAIITFFPTLINMTRGLREVDPLALDLFAIMNASKVQTYFKLRFPSALPYLFSSLRIAAANCYIGAVVGEWIAADKGIGYYVQINLFQLNIDRLYAAVLTSSAAAILFSGVVGLAETLLCRWRLPDSQNR
jgi:NitT/TauT family transport system permease protein